MPWSGYVWSQGAATDHRVTVGSFQFKGAAMNNCVPVGPFEDSL